MYWKILAFYLIVNAIALLGPVIYRGRSQLLMCVIGSAVAVMIVMDALMPLALVVLIGKVIWNLF